MDDMSEDLVNFLVETAIQSEKKTVKRKSESWQKLVPSIKEQEIDDPVEQFKRDYQNAKPYESDMSFYMLATGKLMSLALKTLTKEEGELNSSSEDGKKKKKHQERSDRKEPTDRKIQTYRSERTDRRERSDRPKREFETRDASPKKREFHRMYPRRVDSYKYGYDRRNDYRRRDNHQRNEYKRQVDKRSSESVREKEGRNERRGNPAKKSCDRVDVYPRRRQEGSSTREKDATKKPELDNRKAKRNGRGREGKGPKIGPNSKRSERVTTSYSFESDSVLTGPSTITTTYSSASDPFIGGASSQEHGDGSSQVLKTPRHPDEIGHKRRHRKRKHKRSRKDHGSSSDQAIKTPRHPFEIGHPKNSDGKSHKHDDKERTSKHSQEGRKPAGEGPSKHSGETEKPLKRSEDKTPKHSGHWRGSRHSAEGNSTRNVWHDKTSNHSQEKAASRYYYNERKHHQHQHQKTKKSPNYSTEGTNFQDGKKLTTHPRHTKSFQNSKEHDNSRHSQKAGSPKNPDKTPKSPSKTRTHHNDGKHHEDLKPPKDYEKGNSTPPEESDESRKYHKERRFRSIKNRPPTPYYRVVKTSPVRPPTPYYPRRLSTTPEENEETDENSPPSTPTEAKKDGKHSENKFHQNRDLGRSPRTEKKKQTHGHHHGSHSHGDSPNKKQTHGHHHGSSHGDSPDKKQTHGHHHGSHSHGDSPTKHAPHK